MEPSSSLKGLRKRWRDAAASSQQPAEESNAASEEVEEATDVETPAGVTLESSFTVSKKSCNIMADNAIASAFQVLRQPVTKLPWETGPLAPVFSGKFPLQISTDLPRLPLVGIQDISSPSRPSVKEVEHKHPHVVSLTGFVKKRIAASKFNISDDDLRVRALGRFKNLICSDLQGTKVGLSLLDRAGKLCEPGELATIVSDTLSHKSTGTLLKRASSMVRFFIWIVKYRDTSCFRPSEQDLYDYMNYLRSSGAGATSASHFEQAFRMCHELLGMIHVDIKAILSSRVTGAAHSMFLSKRKLKQSPAFSVEAVTILEDVCLSSESIHKRVISGAILFCIFACSRWFDAMYIESIWDNNFATMVLLEADTEKHKTSMTKESKTRLLPFVCVGRLLAERAWGSSFMKAREHFNLSKPFLPSWNESSQTFAKHRMTTCEATCWIHELLEPAIGSMAASKFSSHSCKATILTWAAMTDLFSREERTLLGHHVEAQTRSSTTYSRDALVMLQYKVCKLISLIKTGRLKPDASRAERLSMMLDEGATDAFHDADDTPLNLESSSDDSDDVASPGDELEVDGDKSDDSLERGDFSFVSEAEQWVVHVFTGVAHYQMDQSDPRLACGRTITTNLRVVGRHELDDAGAVLCKQCESAYKKHTVDTYSPISPLKDLGTVSPKDD